MKLPIEYFRQNIFHKKNIEFPTNIYSVENIHWKVEITNWYFIDRFDSVGNLNNSDGFFRWKICPLEIKIFPKTKRPQSWLVPQSPCILYLPRPHTAVALFPPPSPLLPTPLSPHCCANTVIVYWFVLTPSHSLAIFLWFQIVRFSFFTMVFIFSSTLCILFSSCLD